MNKNNLVTALIICLSLAIVAIFGGGFFILRSIRNDDNATTTTTQAQPETTDPAAGDGNWGFSEGNTPGAKIDGNQ
ncbi:hypothetical protein [Corynebacterium uterequi]|uniref:Uncharacterized protein n=1 Tax=Corynebacterium uterequi TaxID=1072256 RepID=A0A0G3HB65_9CORY|nr:hypothetical protein [Corynebacterium uterequi]AKK10559.1 hypothetical protein CUTER_02725 [Corynebacterium uterequi]